MPAIFPVIDLFAGPGGLGEGFSAFTAGAGARGFDVRLSIEMDAVAHQTLLLRKFFRAFDEPPDHYYACIAGTLTRDELFSRYPVQHRLAQRCAWQAELGRKNQAVVSRRINQALDGSTAWALIGGPPCQAYSLVGRSRMQSRTNPEFEKDHRHFLYREYLSIVARHRPPVFLMENVKGLLSATHGGENIFPRILSDLHQPGRALKMRGRSRLRYRLSALVEPAQRSLIDTAGIIEDPENLVVRAEQFGIPQSRHRVFVLGIREDIRAAPGHLQTSGPVHVESVIADLPRIRSTLSREDDSLEAWRAAIDDVRNQPWFRSPQHPDLRAAAGVARAALDVIASSSLGPGHAWLPHSGRPRRLSAWYRADCRGISNHEARGHMRSDLHRYLFAACFARAHGRSPTLEDFPPELLPDHRNAERGRKGGMFSDRFRVQLPDHPSTTVTSHISKDGHYFIHPDPAQCRSLTVREAARLQTFPDSYHFEGPRTEQYHQVGNAVPPLLATQIAAIVHDVLKQSPGS